MSQKSLETKEKILECAIALLNEQGFAAVTVADIARAAGISTGNLSYHFPTKHDLVVALWERSAKRHLELLSVEWRSDAVLEQLAEWVRSLCGVMWDFRFLYRDRDQYRAQAPELRQRTRETLVTRGRELLAGCLDTLVEAGFMEADAAHRAHLATGCWIVLRYWIDYLVEARDITQIERRHVEELTEQLLGMLRPYLAPQVAGSFAD